MVPLLASKRVSWGPYVNTKFPRLGPLNVIQQPSSLRTTNRRVHPLDDFDASKLVSVAVKQSLKDWQIEFE